MPAIPPLPDGPLIDLKTGQATPEFRRWLAELERIIRGL